MPPQILFYLILSIVILGFIFDQIVDFKNATWFSKPIPDILSDVYDVGKYKQQQNYKFDNYRFSVISSGVSFALMLLMLLCKGFAFINHIVLSITDNYILQALLFFGIFYGAVTVIALPFSIYETFVIEKKYGFNTTTPRIFISDILKSTLLSTIIGGALLALVVYIYVLTTTYFWVLAWVLLTTFSLFMGVFYSTLIVPLFNKQTPLEEGELRTAILNFAEKSGFNISNIFLIDGSKRSTKANAYFTGLGKRKRIVLYDTLIQEMTTDEIVAVLAHEIGHFKYKHIYKSMIYGIIQMGIMLFIFGYFASDNALSAALGVERATFHIALIAFIIIYSPISMVLDIFSNVQSRKNEYQADNFTKEHGISQHLITALKKLSSHNMSNLTPHPWTVFLEYSHPPLYERIKNLE
ncbi:MAG: M48 family metallopeptidase [Bacteroidetes bacterium]|nr:M48 family metallopeptidase [Bacteroidota bacterium]MCL1968871.1 M48 family metallopeptidase [Bacteroidota bacterium]